MSLIVSKTFVKVALILGFTLGSTMALSNDGGTSANSKQRISGDVFTVGSPDSLVKYRVVPFVNYYESQALPPDLFVKFHFKCYQTLVKVLRTDLPHPGSHKDSILIGALVAENLQSPCSGTYETTELAGKTFSGREFEVKPIQ